VKTLLAVLTGIILLSSPAAVYAASLPEADARLDLYDFSPVESVLSGSGAGFSIADLAERAVTGRLELSPEAITQQAGDIFFSGLRESNALLRNLLIIALLSAFLKVMTESFKSHAVGELGFYVCFIVLVMLVCASFSVAAGAIRDLVLLLCAVMEAALPLIVSLLVMSGSVSGAYAFHPLLVFAINAISFAMRDLFTPFIMLAASAEIVNCISEKEILNRFCALMKLVCGWGLKVAGFLFVSALSLQRLSAPLISGLAGKAAKAALGAVPVVGQALNGAADLVAYWAGVTKSGVMLAVIIGILILCAVPVLKTLAMILIYKFAAAAVQPICDPRMVKCLDTAGSYMALLLGAGVLVCVMFTISALVVMSF
jgi:stage III sporulation protein AE